METLGSRTQPGRNVQRTEMCIFLLLIAPSLVFSFVFVKQATPGFVLTAFSTILRDVGLVCLILYFLWRNAEAVARIGWGPADWPREAMIGMLLFLPMFYAAAIVDGWLRHFGFSAGKVPLPALVPGRNPLHLVVALVLVTTVALAEETIFRGYLILRLEASTGSRRAALLLSALIFSFGHGYEGSAGVITVGLMGLAFALVYVWRGSLIAPVVMHFLQDFVTVLLLPLVRHH